MAQRFLISESWVRWIKQERREQGKTAPWTTRRRTPIWREEAESIRAAIAQSSDLTLDELKVKLQTSLSRTTLCRALQSLKLTLKKSLYRQRATAAGCRRASRDVAGLALRDRSAAARVYR